MTIDVFYAEESSTNGKKYRYLSIWRDSFTVTWLLMKQRTSQVGFRGREKERERVEGEEGWEVDGE